MTATKRAPRMREGTVQRREDILKAALQIFGAKGYKNGSLADIAEQVDMTHAGILHHFGSKDALLLEVLSYRDSTDVENLDEKHIPGGLELFRHLIRTAMLNQTRPGIVQAYAVLSADSVTDDHPARAYFEERYRILRGEVREAFEALCAERGIDDPRTVANASAAILAAMDGLQVQWLLDPSSIELADATDFAIRSILAAVLTPRESVLDAPQVLVALPDEPDQPGGA